MDPDPDQDADALCARLNLQYCQEMEARYVERSVVASLPLWLQVFRPVLPGALTWMVVLVQAGFLCMVGTWAALGLRWRRRAAGAGAPTVFALHGTGPGGDLRAASWWGLALASLVPWAYVAGGRSIPDPLLRDLGPCAAAVLVLVALLEVVPPPSTSGIPPRPPG